MKSHQLKSALKLIYLVLQLCLFLAIGGFFLHNLLTKSEDLIASGLMFLTVLYGVYINWYHLRRLFRRNHKV